MQVQVITPVRFESFTLTRKVSGGEIATQIKPNGQTVYWFNTHRIDRATALRKLGH